MPISTVGAEGCRRQRGGGLGCQRAVVARGLTRRRGTELELGLKQDRIGTAPRPGPSRWILCRKIGLKLKTVVEGGKGEASGKDRMHLLEMDGSRGGRCTGAVR